jgi:methyltransferase
MSSLGAQLAIGAWNPYSVALLLFVTAQRLAELALAARNTRRLLAQGAFEAAPEHYRLVVLLHAAWLIGLWLLAPTRAPDAVLVGIYALLQAARLWVLTTLGERWTTRIIILPGAPLVQSGPYRFVSHPNYWVVAGEILVLPLVFGLASYALVFTVLNAAVLTVRIRAEDRALRQPG